MKLRIGLAMLACGTTLLASAALPARAQTGPSGARPATPAPWARDTGRRRCAINRAVRACADRSRAVQLSQIQLLSATGKFLSSYFRRKKK